MKRLFALIGALVLIGAIVAGVLYAQWNNAVPIFAMAINYVRYLSAPAGSMTTNRRSGLHHHGGTASRDSRAR